MSTAVQAKVSSSLTPVHANRSSFLIQRKCGCGNSISNDSSCESCGDKGTVFEDRGLQLLNRSTETGSPNSQPTSDRFESHASQAVNNVLRSSGRSLDRAALNYMEPRFGRDFGSVRIHADSKASESAQSLNAQAYTVGNQIVFSNGQYNPNSNVGRRLLAHELTHVVQQSQHSSLMKQSYRIDAENSLAESEADRVAEGVVNGGLNSSVPSINERSGGLALQRQAESHQQRGGDAKLATLDGPQRGEDQSRIRIFRYLCMCQGRDVSRSDLSARVSPRPGVVYQFCRGRTTVEVLGEVVPSSLTAGTVSLTADLNVAPGDSGFGGRARLRGQADNTGDELRVGGSLDGTLETPAGSPNVTGRGEASVGIDSGRVDTGIGIGLDINGTNLRLDTQNIHDDRRGFTIGIGGTFGGPRVRRDTCRKCECPVVYDCFEDIPPRRFEEEVSHTVNERSRFRYYFQLNTSRDTRSQQLRAESNRSLDRLVLAVQNGAEISSVRGFASPEAGEATRNSELSTLRGERLREILMQRLGQTTTIPNAEVGGELLGSAATIAPGSGLGDALLDTGFGDAEDVSNFLFGDEIENSQLDDQFLNLLNRIPERADRLRLFGIAESSPIANRLNTSIDQFIASGGRGDRPWERVFEFLRFASVEIIESRQETRTESRTTRGSLRSIGEAPCNQYSRQAEREDLFGAAEAAPSRSECSPASPINHPDYESKCKYD